MILPRTTLIILVSLVFVTANPFAKSQDAKRTASPNLIREPSFEGAADATGWPAGWFGLHAQPQGAYRFEITDGGRTGKKSLHITGTGEWGVAWGEKLPIDRAKRVQARGFVKVVGDDAAAADVKLQYYGASEEYVGQSRIGWVNPRTPGWQPITVTDQFDLFPNAKSVSIAVSLAGKGEAWIDDIELTAAPMKRIGPTDYVANGNMEDIAADRPAGWYIAGSDGSKPVCRVDEIVKKTGQRSLYLEGNGEWTAAGSVQIAVEPFRLLGGNFEGWVRVKRGEARLEIAFFKDGQYLGTTQGTSTDQNDWTPLTAPIDLKAYPEATHVAAVGVLVGDGAAWFDSFIVNTGGKK